MPLPVSHRLVAHERNDGRLDGHGQGNINTALVIISTNLILSIFALRSTSNS
jgi:hypothetical protein